MTLVARVSERAIPGILPSPYWLTVKKKRPGKKKDFARLALLQRVPSDGRAKPCFLCPKNCPIQVPYQIWPLLKTSLYFLFSPKNVVFTCEKIYHFFWQVQQNSVMAKSDIYES